MKKLNTVFVLILFLFVAGNSAELTKVGATSANFLQLALGARASALGGAYVAIAEGPYAIYWNPAGISHGRGFRMAYQNGALYAGLRQQALAMVYSVNEADNLGILINHLDIGEMEETTLEEPEGTGQTFDASNMAVSVTYGRQLTNRVSFGVTAKYIQERIWLEVARGYAFDIGTLYTIEERGLRIGMALTNLGPDMGIGEAPHLRFYKEKQDGYPGSPQPEAQLVTKKFPLPLCFALGISANVIGARALRQSGQHRLTVAVSVNDAFDAPLRSNYGVEYAWQEALFLRAGLYQGYDAASVTLGFGLNIKKYAAVDVQIDYAWSAYGDLGNINTWGLEFRF